ncbi:ABC transporter ATP-binding protein [Aeromicrobium yanjiei]|uniref:ATP-binding cassette domain-containing protein n=1 Tax=Aeromicrobium yanjiei TaxID=2662028 RepID=A0A5Q2MEK4_9ACTN|nr:ABC transporter ATP-binding protein [Aeromicrobium yanjiei]QGG41547.1 ATP-binding cassette domain-containing protein [Aeromicrobium yanjiei]
MSTILELKDLAAGYSGGRPVVRDLNLAVEQGEILALLGPNGAGKTTMLLTASGLLPSLSGSIEIDGTPVKSGNARAAVRAGLVLVPDDRALFTTLTVEENLRLSRQRKGTTVDKVLSYFPALKERFKVGAGQLSGGEQQMLAIGRALMQDPKVLLIDELSMGLAPVIVEGLLPVLRRVADDTGAAILLVEQHVMLALDLADTAVVVAHGQEVLRGAASDLARSPQRIEQAYLGSAPPLAVS